MAFLTRWDDDHSRPTFLAALKDALLRAALPSLALFAFVVAVGMLLMGPLHSFAESENSVNVWFEERRTDTWNTVSHYMSVIGNTEYVIGMAVLVALVVWWRTREWWFAVVPLISISLQATWFVAAAWIVGRERPDVEQLDDSPPTSSYPSGHVGASTALYVSFALMATRIQHVVVRRVVVVLCLLAPALVTFARLYRGMHHVTDVTLGLVNGIVCALLAWNYLRRDGSHADDHDDHDGTEGAQVARHAA
jgi:membrane-associated phospholipid phosphatase